MNPSLNDQRALAEASLPKKAPMNDLGNHSDTLDAAPSHSLVTKKKKTLKKPPFQASNSNTNNQAIPSPDDDDKLISLKKKKRVPDEASCSSIQDSDDEELISFKKKKKLKKLKNKREPSSLPSTVSHSDSSNPESETASHRSSTSNRQILSRARLHSLVQGLDAEAKEEFAWMIHNDYGKNFWYDFRPPEKYCANNAFVPIKYQSLIPPDTHKTQIKKKTTSLVLKRGIQGIHFAIGWQELFGLLMDYGVFEDDGQGDKLQHKQVLPLVDFKAPSLDLNIMGSSPTKGSLLSGSLKSRKATQGVRYNRTGETPSPQEAALPETNVPVATVATKRRAAEIAAKKSKELIEEERREAKEMEARKKQQSSKPAPQDLSKGKNKVKNHSTESSSDDDSSNNDDDQSLAQVDFAQDDDDDDASVRHGNSSPVDPPESPGPPPNWKWANWVPSTPPPTPPPEWLIGAIDV